MDRLAGEEALEELLTQERQRVIEEKDEFHRERRTEWAFKTVGEVEKERKRIIKLVESMPVFKVLAENGNDEEFVFKKDVLQALKERKEEQT